MDSEETPRRRIDDIRGELRAAVADAMTVYRLTLDRLDEDMRRMKFIVFGDPTAQVVGVVGRLDKIEHVMMELGGKIDQVLRQQEARTDDWREMRAFLDKEDDRQTVLEAVRRVGDRSWKVLLGTLGLVGTVVGIIGGLIALGVIKL